jgi:hypothetical protein
MYLIFKQEYYKPKELMVARTHNNALPKYGLDNETQQQQYGGLSSKA